MFIGSENFSTSSLSYNRELGVITTSPKAILAVETAVDGDYAHGASVAGGGIDPHAHEERRWTGHHGDVVREVRSARRRGLPECPHGPGRRVVRPTITLPSGYTSESRGLGATRTDGAGDATWTWEIGPSTDPGTARATITCTVGTLEKSFQIR